MTKNRLKLLRNTLCLSQNEVAIKSGVSYAAYRNYEEGRSLPSYSNLILLSDFFAVSVDYLIGRNDEINTEKYGKMYADLREEAYEKYLRSHTVHSKGAMYASAEYPYNLLESIYCGIKYPFTTILSFDQKKGLKWALNTLTEKQIKVIKKRFKYGKTLEEVSVEMGVTRERVRQIEAKALRTLQNPSRRTAIEKGYEAACLEKELSSIRLLKMQIEKEREELDKLKKLKAKYNARENNSFTLSLDSIGLSHRSYNGLRRAGCTTIEQVLDKFKDGSINKIRNLGKRSIDDIVARIYEHTGIDGRSLECLKK